MSESIDVAVIFWEFCIFSIIAFAVLFSRLEYAWINNFL